jgi:multiple sugar transport system permease protein
MSNHNKLNAKLRGSTSLIWFTVPLLMFLALLFIYPVAYEVYISFFEHTLGSATKTFVGFGNYVRMFTSDSQFAVATLNTATFVALGMLCELVLGFSIALALNRRGRIVSFLRGLIIIPTSLTPLAVGMAWRSLYSPDVGAIPYYLKILGASITAPTLDRSTALLALIVVEVWQWTPLVVLLLLAGLKSLPTESYEAGRVDGASRWQLFCHLTVPFMRPILLLTAMIRLIDGLKTFDIIWSITGGGPGTATTVLNLRVYDVGIQQLRVGYAAALSNVIGVMGLLFGGILIYVLYSKRFQT